jgi:phage terminase small subunit
MAKVKLSAREAAFVAAISQGLKKGDAAVAAGYAPSSAHVSASRLLNRETVLKAIRENAEKQLSAGVAVGARVLLELAESAKTDDVRLRAATALLDRGGMQLIRQSETRHIVDDRRTDAELLEHVKTLSRQLGVPLDSRIIDVDPVEVAPAALPAPADPFGD